MAKPSITDAINIDADVVLQLGKYHSAQKFRQLQAKLTGTAREIRGLTAGNTLLARIGEKLSDEQLHLLRDAAKLIESVGYNIEHAKEKRQRAEVTAKALQKERDRTARVLVTAAYSLPNDTLEQKLNIIRQALAHSKAGCFQPFFTSLEISLRFRNFVASPPRLHLANTRQTYWESKVDAFRIELREEVQLHLAIDDGRSVQERFDALQGKVQKLLPEVMNDSYEVETLRLWADALRSTQQEALQ